MRIAAIAIVALLCSGPAFAADAPVTDNWSELRDPAGVFSIEVPQAATISNSSTKGNNGVDIPVVEYMVDRGTSAMILMVGDFTNQSVDPSAAADGAVRGVSSENRTLLTNQVDDLDGQSGRFVTLTDTDGLQYTDRIFFVGGRLYQAITVLPKAPAPGQAETATHFSQSLHFLVK